MLQSIAAWLLKTYVGEYIENFNADQLTIGYGGIELENLILKPSALKKLQFPLKLISGCIGRLNLVIPYAKPSSEPWIFKIGDLSLTVELDTSVNNDYNFEEELKKKIRLEKLETEWKISKQNASAGSWWSRSWFPSIYSSISTRIADNLQVDIKNVHVQYVLPHISFSLVIESLSAHTTNWEWMKTTQASGNDMKFKLAELQGLSLYSHCPNSDSAHSDQHYILGPVYAEARIKRNASKVSLTSKDGPRFHIQLLLEDVLLSLTNKQYKVGVEIAEDLNRYFRSLGHSKDRPTVSVKDNPKLWWHFAFKQIIEPIKEKNLRSTKDFIVQRAVDVNKYAVTYSKHLRNEVLNSDERQLLEDVEGRMKFEEIAIVRRALYAKHDNAVSATQMDAPPQVTSSWSGWIMSFNPLWSQQSAVNSEPLSMTKEEEMFLDELNEMSVEGGESLFNRDSVFVQFAFNLSNGCINLKNGLNQEILNVSFNGLNILSDVHSKAKLWEWTMTLKTFVIRNPDPNDNLFPNLMSPQKMLDESAVADENMFLSIKFGQRQHYGKCLYNVGIKMQPSNVVYKFSAMVELKNFFVYREDSKYNFKLNSMQAMTQRLQDAVHMQIRELKLATKTELNNIIAGGSQKELAEVKDEWTLDLDVNAPRIIIPVQPYDIKAVSEKLLNKMVILDLGRLTFYNDHARHKSVSTTNEVMKRDEDEDEDDSEDDFLTPSSTPPQDDYPVVDYIDSVEMNSSQIMEKFYDNYTLELSNIQVLVSDISKYWSINRPKGFRLDHILEECSIKFHLKRRICFTTDPDIPALTLSTVLPQIYVHIDETKLSVIFQCINMLKATFDNAGTVENQLEYTSSSQETLKGKTSSNMFQISYEDLLAESKLLVAKFSIEKVSLALYSRGRCLTELQIEGVECEFVKRPHDLSTSFILSSLLLVDAMQTFGDEYELLVSSKCVTNSNREPNEVLIHIWYQMIDADCPSLGNNGTSPLQIISANFNALHINANLQTIVELHNVVCQVLNYQQASLENSKVNMEPITDELQKEFTQNRIEIEAHFKQIDILLFYTITKSDIVTPQKVASILAGDLQLNSVMSSIKSSSGSIGSIVAIDLSPESFAHKQIFTVGYQGERNSSDHTYIEEQKAFTFKYINNSSDSVNDTLDIEMASAYYTHNPHFLKQVGLCVGDFKQHAYNLAKSLQTAASDMAKSMVTAKRPIDNSLFKKCDKSVENITEYLHEPLRKSHLLFSMSVDTPIVYFPRDLTSDDMLVANLGKITMCNSFFTEPNQHFGKQNVDRVTVEIQKINLSVLKLPETNVHNIDDMHIHVLLARNHVDHIMIIHNTDVFLQVDKLHGQRTPMQNVFNVEVRVDTGLKLFLSVPTYAQILSTAHFASNIMNNEQVVDSQPDDVVFFNGDSDDPVDDVSPDVTANFQMPSLELELHGELRGKQHGFVNILCENFFLKYKRMADQVNILQVTLQDFVIKDLLRQTDDMYRYLFRSHETAIDTNCPTRLNQPVAEMDTLAPAAISSTSLPDVGRTSSHPLQQCLSATSFVSLSHSTGPDPLISVKIVSGDKISDKEKDQAKKKLTIDVNGIDMVINLQTWVILFDFFGIGAPSNPPSPAKTPEDTAPTHIYENFTVEELEKTLYRMNIKSVNFYMNKEEYPLAKVGVDALKFNAFVSNLTQDVSGRIGSVELHDMSPHRGSFVKRLMTLGDNAIEFSFYRYAKPDPDLRREFDMSLSLYMSSIQYIHTQRFLIECISFCQHFVFLQEVLGRMHAASAGDEVLAFINRCPRVKLKVNTDTPILILPRKSVSQDVLVVNLGKLDVENEFVYASDPSTEAFNFIASRSRHNVPVESHSLVNKANDRLLDCISVKLSDMQLYTAVKLLVSDEFEKQGLVMMNEPCTLMLKVERNLEWAFGRQVPDMSVTGQFSSVCLCIDLAQYSQIMDMLADNLGEPLDTFSAPSTVLVDPLVLNLPTQQLWTTLQIKLHLSNVSIEVHNTFSYGELRVMSGSAGKLAKFDLIKSDLLFESFSDGSKSIDLMSSDVLIHDIRYTDKIQILLPAEKDEQTPKDYLQFEIHYLDTKDKNHLTFLCNQSRILLLFDFLYDTSCFILRVEENKHKNKLAANSPVMINIAEKSPLKPSHQNLSSGQSDSKKSFELKVNVTDSELVIVEDTTTLDTRTVILKTTAVFVYRPDHFTERPVTCSLQSLEIFSCHLNQPDDSALSIVDPVAFLVELKAGKKLGTNSHVLCDATQHKPQLDIQFQVPMYLRLSYHDVQMFMQIAESAKEQISKALERSQSSESSVPADISNENACEIESKISDPQVTVGDHFSIETGILNSAIASSAMCPTFSSSSILDITSNSNNELPSEIKSIEENAYPISGFEVKINFVSITLIDDCGNTEVPLADLSMTNLVISHNYDLWKGMSDCFLEADYYNTRVSAWEPLLEQWRFNLHWLRVHQLDGAKTAVKIGAPSQLNINLTTSFIDIANTTANLWTSRFYLDASLKEKKRAPFLPFLLRNNLGCKLTFFTQTKVPAKVASKTGKREYQNKFDVETNQEVAFAFEGRSKQRHQASHKLLVHQIVLQIPDKYDIQPITVDRVGHFFRTAYNTELHPNSTDNISPDDPQNDIYILIDIKLEGARKVITIKTALSITNKLSVPIEIKGVKNEKHYTLTTLDAEDTYIVPLPLIQCTLFCRPIKGNSGYQLSDEINWKVVTTGGERGFIHTCEGEIDRSDVFRFCAFVQCIGFPKCGDFVFHELPQPEHTITILHHVEIYNQLPFDLFYIIRDKAMKELVKPGKMRPLHLNHDHRDINIGFSFENFPRYDWIKIPYEERNNKYVQPVRVFDSMDRVLLLHAVIACRAGAMQISIFSPYWLVNKTGMPLVFRRGDETIKIAGQFEEHEEARSLTPLPFSFLGGEDNYNCQMRVGRGYQGNVNITPHWSKSFSLDKESDSRTLYVRENETGVEKGFNIGIVMTWGKGAFSQTKIVSFVPRFQVDNQTSQVLYISQKCMLVERNHRGTLCPKDAVTIFHWPRCNIDNLLCVRFDDSSSSWSGCLRIDQETTFHIHVKSVRGDANGVFLRVHVSFHSGTFRATITDANTFPPPFKLVNGSDVILKYRQEDTSKATDEYSFSLIKPNEVKYYVFDEPLMPEKLVVTTVYEDSVRVYDLRQNGRKHTQLVYENPFFIGFSHTFGEKCTCKVDIIDDTSEQLVVEATKTYTLRIAQKDAELALDLKSPQLWRMNPLGNIVLYNTTGKETRKSSSSNVLVLDIDDKKPIGPVYPLILNRLDDRRKKTQEWRFEANTLRCGVEEYIVYMHKVSERYVPVLGPKRKAVANLMNIDIHISSCIQKISCRPGSSVLSAYVYSSGPTQVLEISDSQQDSSFDSWMMIDHATTNPNALTCTTLKERPSLEVVLSLASGFGISIINFNPEEVLFISLSQINLTLTCKNVQYVADLEVGKIQVDNQLFGCQIPVCIYASPPKKVATKQVQDLRLVIDLVRDLDYNLFVFKKLSLYMARMTIMFEDRLFLKILQTVQHLMSRQSSVEEPNLDEQTSVYDSHKIHCKEECRQKFFVEDITINQGDLTLSLIVTGKIDKDLQQLKNALSIPLFSFEGASFGFDKYHKNNIMYEHAGDLLSDISKAYKTTFNNQAKYLLGSLDFLGNPRGLLKDFSSGFSKFFDSGDLGGLFVNVAHGFSDSAAKVTGKIADGLLYGLAMDNKFVESRDSLRVSRDSSSSTHFLAGLRGLGMGAFGGVMGVVTQPIEGASKKGVSGFLTGLGKGLVGTVAKPMAGVLDLASGTAAAVRNTTESTSLAPQPVQMKRNCYGPGGVLGKYNKNASEGQELLLKFNDGNTAEKYIGMESVRANPDRLKALFTNNGVYFVKSGPPCSENVRLHVEYSRLVDASHYFEKPYHIIAMYFCRQQNVGVRQPKEESHMTVRCDNDRVAFKVCEKMNYLKSLYLENMFVVPNTPL